MSSRRTVAVVVPIYNEAGNLPELYDRLRATFARAPGDLEFRVIYVNDGSTDASLAIIREHTRTDPRFGVVDLSRNFGQQAALTAGLDAVDADAVVMIDGDLQDPPEVILDLVAMWRDGAEVVRATRRSRQDTGIRRLGFGLFYPFLHWISDYPIPANSGIFGLLDRRALHELRRLPEKNRFLPGLRAWIGFDQRTLDYDRERRASGKPGQSLRRLVSYALDGVFSFSYKPLRLMVAAGICVSGVGFVLAMVFVVKRLMGIEQAQMGFTTLVTVTLFLGGVQLIATGLVGEYLARIYDEVKRRPLYIVREHSQGKGQRAEGKGRDEGGG